MVNGWSDGDVRPRGRITVDTSRSALAVWVCVQMWHAPDSERSGAWAGAGSTHGSTYNVCSASDI